jgi:bifunctional non-homologous end joining protein LigD
MPDRLNDYRGKRTFDDTPEPGGEPREAAAGDEPTFVIHEHHATRLHWDLRLERDGVLVSWAVPNGIPFDPKHNRLAVHVEDHPLAYGEFEGTIPEGNYGAGEVTIWDSGTYTTEKWRKDEVMVVFHGERLRGKYVLFKTGRKGKENDWMLHRMDPAVDPDAEPIPEQIQPMMASPGVLPADQSEWAFEVKWDGVRAIARSEPGRLALVSRTGRDITSAYPELHALNRELSSHSAILDGEIVGFDEDGKQSFSAVQQRIHLGSAAQIKRLANESPVTFMIFDLLWLDGHSLVDLEYEQRRKLLEELELGHGAHWDVPASHVGAGTELLAATAEQQLEGVIAKRLGSVYEPGHRSSQWRKIKNTRRQEVVIGGFTPGRGRRKNAFGALQVGVYDKAGELRFAGGVGTGFTDQVLREVEEALSQVRSEESPFEGRQPPRGTHFVEPTLVCEVEFAEWTGDGSLRHPTFRGLRFDKPAEQVVREAWFATDEKEPAAESEEQMAATKSKLGEDSPAESATKLPKGAGAGRKKRAGRATAPELPVIDGRSIEVGGHTVKLTNLDKILYPKTQTTKREVIEYYAAIAEVMVPHLTRRPTTLKRFPDGVEGQSFFEKNANRYRPDWVQTVEMPVGGGKDKSTINYVAVEDQATLLWTANLAAIELHPSLSKHPDGEVPTALVFDLDPGEPATIVECCTVALEIRALLTQLDLDCWAKTSGSKGLQLYAPLNVPVTYDDTTPFSQAVATLLEARHPELVVSKQTRSLRPGKVLIDWSQNNQSKTTVGVYSMRARPEPTVSTPVTWDEVAQCAEGGDPLLLRFDKDQVLARVAEHGDLFAPLLDLQQALPKLGT